MAMNANFLAQLAHPAHQRLYRHWCEKAPPQGLPGRQDLDPEALKDLAPWIGEIDVERAQSRLHFRYRHAGKAIVAARGSDPSGRLFDDSHQGTDLTNLRLTYIQAVAKKRPSLTGVLETMRSGATIEDERLILPLATDGELVDAFIYLVDYSLTD